jgi:RHS repeat-associated protein
MALRLRPEQSNALRKASVAGGLVERLASNGGNAEYDPRTSTVHGADAMQRRKRIRLDASGFIEEIQSGSGRTLKFACDSEGRTTALVEPSGQQTAFTYDANGQVTAVSRNGIPLYQLGWNHDKSECALRFWDGSTASAAFDSDGRPLRLVNRLGGIDTFKYDSKGRLQQLTNARGESTHFELNAQGLPGTTTHVDGRRESVLSYDDMGNPTAVAIDGVPTFAAAYSLPGCPTAISYADGSEYRFVRDDKGRVLEANGPGSKTTFVYGDHGLPLEETTNGKTFRYRYDATGLLTDLEYPDGSRVSFTYDEDKRVASCTDWQGGTTFFAYDAQDRTITRRTPNQLTQYVALHSSGKPERIAITSPQGNLLADSQFAYDVTHRLTTRVDGAERRDYVYDTESQLIGVHSNQRWLENYAYDATGNRSASHWGLTVVEAGNRLTRQGLDTLEYDTRGNVTAAVVDGNAWRFEYDLKNQLVAAHSPAGSVRYTYDALGRRSSKASPTEQIEYIWCAEQLTQEIVTTAEGVATRDYLYMPATYQPLAMRSDGKCYYFHTSHEGRPERLSDASGQLVWSAQYDAFGHAQIDICKIENPLRFAGQYYDVETGLHYNRFRYYSPRLGRYWSVDPIGLRGDPNLYAYVGNDPVNRIDPLGLWWKTALSVVAGVAAAVGVAALVIATAPVSLPALAIGALAATAGVAVGFGVNEALTVDHFCAICLARGFAKGVVFGAGAVLAIAGAALLGEAAAIAVTAGFIAYGIYSAANLVFHWDNMTHEERMEAIGGALGGVAVGVGVGIMGGPPTLGPGLRPMVTPEGVIVLVPAEAAPATGAGAAAGAGQGAAMSGDSDGSGSDDPEARRKADAERKAQKKQERELNKRAKSGDKDATVEQNKIRAKQQREAGNDGSAEGYEAENIVIEKRGSDVVEAGREVEYADPQNPGKKISSDIDMETTTTVSQVKAGTEMPSRTQADCTRLRAAETGKQPEVIYDPSKMPPEQVEAFKAANPDFIMTPEKLR